MADFVPLAFLFVAGLFTGIYASVAGSGGIVMFSVLTLLGLSPLVAIATNKLGMAILEIASSLKFRNEIKKDLKLAFILGIMAAFGSIIGANIVMAINERVLSLAVALALIIVLGIILLNNKKAGKREAKINKQSIMLAAIATFFLGIYGGFFGPGFGTFVAMLLVFFGFTFLKSSGISRIVGIFMSGTSAIIFAYNGLINYTYGLAAGFGLAIGAWIGVGMALKKGEPYVKSLFVLVGLLTAVKLLLDYFGISVI